MFQVVFLATQVLPVCLSCFHCLFLIVTVLCLLTSWACWPTLGKVDKGSKHWTKQSPAFSLCSFSLSLSPSLPPHFSLTVYCALLPSLLSLWRCVHQHLEKQSCSLTAGAHSPPISLPLLALSLFLSRSVALYVCLLLWKSDRTLRRCWQLTVERTHREGHQRGPTIRLIKDTMAASFSTSPPPHHSFLFWSEFQSLFLKLDCWSDSLITKSFRGDPYSHPLHRPRCSSSTIGGRGIHRLWHDGDLGIGCKLELGVRASGAALLRGSESAQSVQPATDPCAQEAQQHWGQAMGPRPQQAAQTKGFWLTYVHTHKLWFCSLIFFSSSIYHCVTSICWFSLSFILSSSLSVCVCSLNGCLYFWVDYCSILKGQMTECS